MEVLDHRNGNIIFQINKGQGYYHYINDEALYHEYSLRYINEGNEAVSNIVVSLDFSLEFNPLSFVSIANSHINQYSIIGNQIIIEFKDLSLLKGEQLQFRFGIKTYNQPIQNSILIVGASAVVNHKINVKFKSAFNNIKNELEKTIHEITAKWFGKFRSKKESSELESLETQIEKKQEQQTFRSAAMCVI